MFLQHGICAKKKTLEDTQIKEAQYGIYLIILKHENVSTYSRKR